MSPKKVKTISASVIIPAYNAEKGLNACLDALLNQSVLPQEIIVVNDGSKDQTKAIAESYSLVKTLTQKNQGPAKARNAGARAAKSNIIVFLDSDCVPERNWLEEMLIPLEKEKVVGVQGAYKTRQTSLTARFDQLDIEYRYERMKKFPKLDWIGSYSAAYRKKIFLEENGFDESFPRASGEDAELSYRLSEKGHVLAFNPRAIVYHTHPESLFSYLQVKFFRAYWRARMYLKHPVKAVEDSYTPQSVKVNVVLGGAFVASILWYVLTVFFFNLSLKMDFLLLWIPIFYWMVVVSLTFTSFLFNILNKDPPVFLFSYILIPLRSIVFFMGLLFGILDSRVRA